MTTHITSATTSRSEALHFRSGLKAEGATLINHHEALQVRSALRTGGCPKISSRSIVILAALVYFSPAAAAPVGAAPVTIDAVVREIETSTGLGPGEFVQDIDTSVGFWSSSDSRQASSDGVAVATVLASQTSDVSESLFTSAGTGTSGLVPFDTVGSPRAVAESSFNVVFSLSEPQFYDYQSTLYAGLFASPAANDIAVATAYLFQHGGGNPALWIDGVAITQMSENTLVTSRSGVLLPGTYSLIVFSRTALGGVDLSSGTATHSVTFALSDPAPVPEPGTMLLLGGAIGLAVLRRTRFNR